MERYTYKGRTYGYTSRRTFKEVCARLAAYEDTGLTPEEIEGLKNTIDQLQALNDSLYASNQAMGKDLAELKGGAEHG